MREFKDTLDRTWRIAVNVATVRRVEKMTGFHLGKLLEDSQLFRLQSEELLLADILWALVQPDAKEQGIDRESFESGLSGSVIQQATDALLYGFMDFLSDPRRGAILRTLLDQWKQINEKVTDQIENATKQIEATITEVSTAK